MAGLTITLTGAVALAQPAPPGGGGTLAPAEVGSPIERGDLVGWADGFFIRDPRDIVRVMPFGLVEADFYSSFGPGISPDTKTSTAQASDVAAGLKPRLLMRRLRFGFDVELLKRWSAAAVIDFGGQQLGNAAANAETYAAKPGTVPDDTTGRYAPVQTVSSAPYAVDAYVNYSVCKCFNIQIGQFLSPVSMEGRTGDTRSSELERTVATRSFLHQNNPRDVGGMIWGELGPRVFVYELGLFGGDGQNRPSVDSRIDFMGRMFTRPFAGMGSSDLQKYTQIGVGVHVGGRDTKAVGYDYGSMTTGQGFALWKPTYTDSDKRLVHIIPADTQLSVGGELRLKVGRVALQGELYYVGNNAREAVDGYQLSNTERYTRMSGVAWYGRLSAWPVGAAFIPGEPGISRPRHLDLNVKPPLRVPQGLEMIAIASGIHAKYALRDATDESGKVIVSTADAKTPTGDVTIYQLSLGANYWHSKHARVGVYYSAYVTPGSGSKDNRACVPDNLLKDAATQTKANQGHILHELSGRVALTF